MTFNPPPNWPLPRDWTPTADWEPDPVWPPAPPGWAFWVEDPEAGDDATTDTACPQPAAIAARRGQLWRLPVAVVLSIIVLAVLVVGFLLVSVSEPAIKVQPQPHTETIAPTWIDPGWTTPLYVDFSAWTRFGGVDADFSDNGQSVRLNTHDTTDSWRTKWSGLISPLTTTCAARIVGRVHDISHTSGTSGGFGIGLATLAPDDPDDAALSGSAIQFDFGQRGIRTAIYPSDSDHGLATARLDHQWHDIEVIIDGDSHTLIVDGQTIAETAAGGHCGHPVIRVWAGAVEFANFTVTPLG